jgi:DNA-binding transcriptional regulator YiaG
MSNFASQLKSEIARIAKKEIRGESAPLKKSSSQYRSDIAALKKRVATLEALVKKLSKVAQKSRPEAADVADDKNLRFRSAGFATLRKKLGLSANEMGHLLGVSGQSVYKWEQGKAKPRANQLKAIAAVRKMGKKQAHAMLQG